MPIVESFTSKGDQTVLVRASTVIAQPEGPRANEGHIALHDIQDLRQLVQIHRLNEISEPGAIQTKILDEAIAGAIDRAGGAFVE